MRMTLRCGCCTSIAALRETTASTKSCRTSIVITAYLIHATVLCIQNFIPISNGRKTRDVHLSKRKKKKEKENKIFFFFLKLMLEKKTLVKCIP